MRKPGPVTAARTVSPDPATFTMLINYMSADRDIPRLSTIIKKMERFRIQPDSKLVAAVVRALCIAGDLPAAVSVVAPMCSQKKRSAALLLRLGLQSQKTKTPMKSMTSSLSPDIIVFNALLRGASRALGIKGITLTLRLMRENEVVPDPTTVSILVNYLSNHENAQPRTLLRTTRSLVSGSVQPSIKHVNTILKAVTRLEKLWARNNSSPTVRNPKFADEPPIGVQLPTKLSYRTLAKPVTESLVSRRVRNDRVTVSLRIKQATARRDLQGAEEAFRTMLKRGMHANVYHYGALMQAHASLGRLATAEGIFRSAIEAGVKPNATMFTILMSGRRGRVQDARRAMRLFESMLSHGVKPDKGSIQAVAQAFYAAGSHGVARQVLMDMWTHVGPFPEELKSASFRELVRAFCAFSVDERDREMKAMLLGKNHQRMLRWKLRRVLHSWRPQPQPRGRSWRSIK
jgi:pentatricopeptide repeat protein